jgi:CubicO group peptidase (beta-lactamase class C family)
LNRTPSGEVSKAEGRFPAGSIAEQFVAAAILQLELAGQLKLGNSICDYISDCPGEWKPIQLQHLLTHSAGLPSIHGASAGVESAPSEPSAAFATLFGKPLLFKPGSRADFNSLDYLFLSMVIERISGQSTCEYLERHIFRPLNLAQTGYWLRASQQKVRGNHTKTGCADLPASPAPELFTSVDDLNRWYQALSADKFLPQSSLNQMYTPYIEGHAFGWKILKEFERRVAVQNDEFDSGSVSIRVYPDDETCVIVLSRSHQVSAKELSHALGRLLFPRQSSAVGHHH